MREFTIPPTATVSDDDNLADVVFEHAAKRPDLALFSVRSGDSWTDVTAGQFRNQVVAVAKGLAAAGVKPGDRVGLLSKTRYEWTLVDYAIWTAGAVTVPIYETSSAEQMQWILSDSGAVALVVETAAHEATVESVRESLGALGQIWQLDAGAIETLTAAGGELSDAEIEARRSGQGADSPATVIYTSGTTGRPKGVLLTHRNVIASTVNAVQALDSMFTTGAATLLFLPLAHVFARQIQCGCVYRGVRLGHSADVKTLLPDLAVFKPTFLLAVPRVFEKVYNGSKQKAHAEGKGRIFDLAEKVAIEFSSKQDSGGAGLLLKGQHALFDKLVYGKLRAALGGNCTAAISGGAPLGERLGHFFRGIGVSVYEGYGLTESSAAMTANLPGAARIGTVGRPFPGGGVRIADDGEVLLRGDNIFAEYWQNAPATAEAIDSDGWFHTGDLGELDSDGYLTITGRKKELIVTAGGKNVAPTVLEDRLRRHYLIGQAVVVGDRRPFIATLLTIDPDAWPAWLKSNDKPSDATVSDLAEDPALTAELQTAVDEANKAVSKAESIRKFRLLPRDLTEADGELSAKGSIKRHVVMKEYASDVEALYTK